MKLKDKVARKHHLGSHPNLKFEHSTIQSKNSVLTSTWSCEEPQDLKVFPNKRLERELIKILKKEIKLEK
jgi:hypothetical protein